MSDQDLDPYRKWLGIRDAHRPPNHYRLLGLEPYEDDPEVIQNAADQRMAHVRTFQTGKHSELSQRVLNELATAKVCLLNANKKKAYDQQLRQQLEPPPAAPPVAQPSGIYPRAVPPPPRPFPQPIPLPQAESAEEESQELSVDAVRHAQQMAAMLPPQVMPPHARVPGMPQMLPQRPLPFPNDAETSVSVMVHRQRRAPRQNQFLFGVIGAGVALVMLIVVVAVSSSRPKAHTTRIEPNPPPKVNGTAPRAVDTVPWPQGQSSTEPTEPPETDSDRQRGRGRAGRIWPTQAEISTSRPPVSPEQRLLLQMEGGVLAVHFANNGQTVLGVDIDANCRAWNGADGRLIHNFKLAEERLVAAVFSPTEELVLVAQLDGKLRLWDLQQHQLVREFVGHKGPALALTFLSAKLAASAGIDETVRLWQLDRAAEYDQMPSRMPLVLALAPVSGEDKLLVAGEDRRPLLMNLVRRDAERYFVQHQLQVRALATLPGGQQFVSGSFDKTIKQWEVGTGKLIQTLTGHDDAVLALALSADGKRLLSGSGGHRNRMNRTWMHGQDSSVRLWDLGLGTELKRLTGHVDTVTSVGLAPSGLLAVSGGVDKTVRTWDLTKITAPAAVPSPGNPLERTPEQGPVALGTGVLPVDLFAGFEFQSAALATSVEAVPRESEATVLAPPVLPPFAAAGWSRRPGATQAPTPLATADEIRTFEETYAARVSAADKAISREQAFALARELQQVATSSAEKQPGFSRYVLLRAFGLAGGKKGDPALADEIGKQFFAQTQQVPAELQLAVNLAKMQLMLELQRLYKRLERREDANNLTAAIAVTMVDSAAAYTSAHLFDEARKLLQGSGLNEGLKAGDAPLRERARIAREENSRLLQLRETGLKLLLEQGQNPAQPQANADLGLYVLGELGNLRLALPLLEKSADENLRRIRELYVASASKPPQLVDLAKQLDRVAQALGNKPARVGCLQIAAEALGMYLSLGEPEDAARQEAELLANSLRNQLQNLTWVLPTPAHSRAQLEIALTPQVKLVAQRVEPGAFKLAGSVDVTLTRAFYLGLTEVTQEQWTAVAGTNPSQQRTPGVPVEHVSWTEAVRYVQLLNARFGDQYHFRLPTEAEWEFACRAGSPGKYSFGDEPDKLNEYAWYVRNSDDRAHAAARRKPNAWGFYDVQGNVMEWVQDWAQKELPTTSQVDPQGPVSGQFRLLCGGSFKSSAEDASAFARYAAKPAEARDDAGLRVVITPR